MKKRVLAIGVAAIACASVLARLYYMKRREAVLGTSDLAFTNMRVTCAGREGLLGGQYATFKLTGSVTNKTDSSLGAQNMPKIVAETEGYGEARANLSKERLFSWDTCDISYEGELEVKNHALPKVSFSSKLVTEGLGVVEAQLNAGLAQIAKEYADVDAAMKADDERRAAEAKAKQEAFEQAKKSLEDCKGKTADEGLAAAKSAGYSATFKDKSGADVTSDVEDSANESDVHGATIASVETLNLLGNYVAFTLDYAAPKA